MCVRCLREGFIDEFPWPGQDGSGGEESAPTDGNTDAAARGLAQIASWWGRLKRAVSSDMVSLPRIRPARVVPAVLGVAISYFSLSSRDSVIAFNLSIYMSLAVPHRSMILHQLGIKKKADSKHSRKKKKKEPTVVLCRVIATTT